MAETRQTTLPVEAVQNTGEYPEELMKVRDVDWADPKINRAGIVPIMKKNNKIFLGFGISNYSANITPIGGGFESKDFDLISTAVREFNEEIGNNFHHLVEESVYNCYAVKSDYTIQIFLPVSEWPLFFQQTEELADFIWITPDQLLVMSQNQDFILPTKIGSTRVFTFAAALRSIAPTMAQAASTGIPLTRTNLGAFDRVKREMTVEKVGIVLGYDAFVEDFRTLAKWQHAAIVLDTNNLAVSRPDRLTFIMPRKYIGDILYALNSNRIMTYFKSDREKQDAERAAKRKGNLKTGLIHSIDDAIRGLRVDRRLAGAAVEDYYRAMNNAHTLNKFDETTRLAEEIKIIHDFEQRKYELTLNAKAFFNQSRACFLKGTTLVTRALARYDMGLEFQQLKRQVSEYACREPTLYAIINTMINLGLIYQDTATSLIYLTRP